jgi:4-hydroxy-4-methyl-2-oxoglutarate aldolase
MLGIAKNRGAAGLVTDGLIRDRTDVEALQLPVFAMGVTPNSPHSKGPGTVGLPVTCGGRTIASGDIVVGDRDGVVTVPRAMIPDVLAKLKEVKAAEAALLERVRGGLKEVASAGELLKSNQVRYSES